MGRDLPVSLSVAVLLDLVGLSIGMAVLCKVTRESGLRVALGDASVLAVVGLVSAGHGECWVSYLKKYVDGLESSYFDLGDGESGEIDASSAWGCSRVIPQQDASSGRDVAGMRATHLILMRGIGLQWMVQQCCGKCD